MGKKMGSMQKKKTIINIFMKSYKAWFLLKGEKKLSDNRKLMTVAWTTIYCEVPW